ncbi:MAG TPA: hypothetical protein PLN48_07215 [Lachnospiraceae bacterium]|nr:hypothetical protein [Lachnospiraceae bacterium]
MSTSDNNKRTARKIFLKYLIASAFCALFGFIYELFSHQVYSNWMIFMFLFPLLLGSLPFGILAFTDFFSFPRAASRNLYTAGIATLTVGSCFLGVLEIYGTTSSLASYYFIIGGLLLCFGLIIYILDALFPSRVHGK